MPIDLNTALAAAPTAGHLEWDASDVLLYHLALGAGSDPTDDLELNYATEAGTAVVPTFAVVAPLLRSKEPVTLSYPGVEVDLRTILHASQRVELHRPLTRAGAAITSTGVANIYDKGSAALLVVDTTAHDIAGVPLWTSSMRMFSRGEGGFGGERGPAGPPNPPDRAPDHVVATPTLPQQALWYRLLGDRNPLHSDPAVATAAGFPRPILHGLCTMGIVCRAVVDAVADGATDRVASVEVRFTGPVFPGETLRTSIWQEADAILFATTVDERDNAPALANGELTLRGSDSAAE